MSQIQGNKSIGIRNTMNNGKHVVKQFVECLLRPKDYSNLFSNIEGVRTRWSFQKTWKPIESCSFNFKRSNDAQPKLPTIEVNAADHV